MLTKIYKESMPEIDESSTTLSVMRIRPALLLPHHLLEIMPALEKLRDIANAISYLMMDSGNKKIVEKLLICSSDLILKLANLLLVMMIKKI